MKRWLQMLVEKMQVWIYGRYGYDEFSKFLSILALICILISPFIPLLYPISMILLIWSMFRSRKTHRYYKCQICKHWLRVPKGKGKIEITCPVCKYKIKRKT